MRYNRTLSLIGASAMLLVLVVPSAQAQEKERKHAIIAYAGGQIFDLSSNLDDAGADIGEEVLFGAGFEYRIRPKWGIEVNASFAPATAMRLGGDKVDVDTWYIAGNINYYLTRSRLQPFLTAGAGAVLLDIDEGDTESRFAGNFGVGVDYRVAGRLSLRASVRDFIYSLKDLDARSAAALGVPVGFDETINDLEIKAGVVFRF